MPDAHSRSNSTAGVAEVFRAPNSTPVCHHANMRRWRVKRAQAGRHPSRSPARPASMPRFRRVEKRDVRRNCRSNFEEVILDQCVRRVDAAERVFSATSPLPAIVARPPRGSLASRETPERTAFAAPENVASRIGARVRRNSEWGCHIPIRDCEFNGRNSSSGFDLRTIAIVSLGRQGAPPPDTNRRSSVRLFVVYPRYAHNLPSEEPLWARFVVEGGYDPKFYQLLQVLLGRIVRYSNLWWHKEPL